jgi:hypothetical protein
MYCTWPVFCVLLVNCYRLSPITTVFNWKSYWRRIQRPMIMAGLGKKRKSWFSFRENCPKIFAKIFVFSQKKHQIFQAPPYICFYRSKVYLTHIFATQTSKHQTQDIKRFVSKFSLYSYIFESNFLLYLCGMRVPEVWGWKRREGKECWGGAPGSRQPETDAESI